MVRRGYPTPDLERRRQRVAELTRQGMSAPQIAEILGITSRTVVRNRRAAGCSQPYENRPMTAEQHQWAELLLADGCSVAEVARTLGRSTSSIHNAFPGRGWTRAQVYEYVAAIQAARQHGIGVTHG